ncbi:unnamed protein product [Pleuronectes platessa]|uniref:Uncharacterized protein n=1 Tax=Pleuronectes platessa TaxID=8262 RepID=A0A9N7YAS1_PLEPL|nr:unnamed protein product [Pleuronectes platessa]
MGQVGADVWGSEASAGDPPVKAPLSHRGHSDTQMETETVRMHGCQAAQSSCGEKRKKQTVMDSCTVTGFPPAACGGGGSDRNRPLGPADLSGSGSGSAHIQLFLSLTCWEKEDRGRVEGGERAVSQYSL